jgi:hypothetical protein
VLVNEFEHGLDLGLPAEGYIRTTGLHASDLYGAYYQAHDPKRYGKVGKDGKPLPMDMLKIEFGLSWEQELEEFLLRATEATRQRMSERLLGDRPGEFTAPHADDCEHEGEPNTAHNPCSVCGAGTSFSPDYLFSADDLILGEFKLSWYSMRDAPFDVKFSKWLTQCRLYCYWLGITKVRLFVYFTCGDYAPPSPKLRAWEITFSRKELVAEHREIMRHARKQGLLVAQGC